MTRRYRADQGISTLIVVIIAISAFTVGYQARSFGYKFNFQVTKSEAEAQQKPEAEAQQKPEAEAQQ